MAEPYVAANARGVAVADGRGKTLLLDLPAARAVLQQLAPMIALAEVLAGRDVRAGRNDTALMVDCLRGLGWRWRPVVEEPARGWWELGFLKVGDADGSPYVACTLAAFARVALERGSPRN